MIDFRSDTVTKPSPKMLAAMSGAPVGDDVFGEDPTVNALEKMTATLFGMEASLFCPSGTMTNQLAIKTHTQAGDEVICEVTLSLRKMRARHITSCHAIDFGRGDTPSNRCSLVEQQSPLTTLLVIQDAVPILRESDRAIA